MLSTDTFLFPAATLTCDLDKYRESHLLDRSVESIMFWKLENNKRNKNEEGGNNINTTAF